MKVRSNIPKVFFKVQYRSYLINQCQARQKEWASSCLIPYFPSQTQNKGVILIRIFSRNPSDPALTICLDTIGMAIKQQQKSISSSKLFLLDVKYVWGRNELFHMSAGSYFLCGSNFGTATWFIKGGFVSGWDQFSTRIISLNSTGSHASRSPPWNTV